MKIVHQTSRDVITSQTRLSYYFCPRGILLFWYIGFIPCHCVTFDPRVKCCHQFISCVQCSQDVLDHQIFHLVYHTRCRFCRFEMRPFEHQSIRWLEDYKQACLNLTRRDAGTCSVCFLLCQDNDKYARKKHEETLHEGKPKQYKCEKCTKSFSNSIALSYHQAKHDNEVTRDTCDLCGSKFSSDGTLLRHKQLVHSEMPAEPEYVCLECGIKFSRKDNLNRHRKENHYDASKANYDC